MKAREDVSGGPGAAGEETLHAAVLRVHEALLASPWDVSQRLAFGIANEAVKALRDRLLPSGPAGLTPDEAEAVADLLERFMRSANRSGYPYDGALPKLRALAASPREAGT